MDSERGQSLLEVIIAMAVGILVVTALVFATIFSLRNAQFAKNSAQATKLAQEGIERARIGRDRNQCIINLDSSVDSWNGNSSNRSCTGTGSIWTYQISGNTLTSCENPTIAKKCYFNIDLNGVLNYIGSFASFPESSYGENISSANQVFQRVVMLSDDANYPTQKTVTIIVQWTDFAGPHESKLTTILRKL